ECRTKGEREEPRIPVCKFLPYDIDAQCRYDEEHWEVRWPEISARIPDGREHRHGRHEAQNLSHREPDQHVHERGRGGTVPEPSGAGIAHEHERKHSAPDLVVKRRVLLVGPRVFECAAGEDEAHY